MEQANCTLYKETSDFIGRELPQFRFPAIFAHSGEAPCIGNGSKGKENHIGSLRDFIYPQSFFVDCLNIFQLAYGNLLDILQFRQT